MDTKNSRLYGIAGKRITQKQVTPSTIKSKLLGEFAFTTNFASGVTTLGNGEQAVFEISTSQAKKFDLLAVEPYISIYIGTPSASTQLPGGASVDESQWQVIGPFYDYQNWSEDPDNAISKAQHIVYVRNISAGAGQSVTLYTQTKYISRTEA